ncbi:transposase [Cupriavidus basilensis]
MAREHGINANMLFTWRRSYRAQQRQEAAVLLPGRPVEEQPDPAPGSEAMMSSAARRLASRRRRKRRHRDPFGPGR